MRSLGSKLGVTVVVVLLAGLATQAKARAQSRPAEQDPARRLAAKAELARRGWKFTPAAFRRACEMGLAESPGIVALFIAAGVDVDATDAGGRTALHGAASAEVVRLLLRANAKRDARDRAGATPLYLAVGDYRRDKLAVVKALVEAGADLSPPFGAPSLLMRAELSLDQQRRQVATYLRSRGLTLGFGERVDLLCQRYVGVPFDQAAPVAVGGLLALLSIVALLWWRRSRRKARQASAADGAPASRPSLLDLLYYCTASRGEAASERSGARNVVSVVLLLGATVGSGVVWWLAASALRGDAGIIAGLLLLAWLLAVGVGAVGYGLGCPRCFKFFSRRTAHFDKTEGAWEEEKIPGTFTVRKEREVSWHGGYVCKRCGHGWSSSGRGVERRSPRN